MRNDYQAEEDNRKRNELLAQRWSFRGSGDCRGHWRNGRTSSGGGGEREDTKTVSEVYEYTTCYWLKAFLVNCIFPMIALWMAPLNENDSPIFLFWRRDGITATTRKEKKKPCYQRKRGRRAPKTVNTCQGHAQHQHPENSHCLELHPSE